MDGKTTIKWCNSIREQVDADNREEQAREKRDLPVDEQITEEVREERVEQAPDPVQFAIHQRDMYEARLKVIEQRISSLKEERTTMRGHYEQWQKVVDTLRGETDE